MKGKLDMLWIVLGVMALAGDVLFASGQIQTHTISLSGTASGGTLVLTQANGRKAPFVEITTSPGASAESVVARLAEAIDNSDPFWWHGPPKAGDRPPSRELASGSTIRLPGTLGEYVFSGTETGLGIPPPPTSLSCSYDPISDEYKLNWINPPGGYDSITIVRNGLKRIGNSLVGDAVGGRRVLGSPDQYSLKRKPGAVGDVDFFVTGIKNGTPSNAAAITLRDNVQVELACLPFWNGVAPNWEAWTIGNDRAADLKTGQEDLQRKKSFAMPVGYRHPIKESADRYFAMRLSTSPSAMGGCSRQFLGLTPGHTYRLCVRVGDEGADTDTEGAAAISVHAYPTVARNALTPRQMAGLDTLPGQNRIHRRDGKTTTEIGRYEIVGKAPRKLIAIPPEHSQTEPGGTDITLPADCDAITVWLRCLTSDPGRGILLQSVSLEDVTEQPKASPG
jgi:hypothetical protein